MIRAKKIFLIYLFASASLLATQALAQKDKQEITTKNIIVPAQVIYAGQEINSANLKEVSWTGIESSLSTLVTDSPNLIGMVAKRTLVTGRPVPKDSIRSAFLVLQGQVTTMVIEDRGLKMSSYGIPLQSGGVGDTIDIRNTQTGLVVRGRVVAPNIVDLGDTQ